MKTKKKAIEWHKKRLRDKELADVVEHTPTPYRLDGRDFFPSVPSIVSHYPPRNSDDYIAHAQAQDQDGLAHANVAFIVRACNSHSKLLEALKMCMKYLSVSPMAQNTAEAENKRTIHKIIMTAISEAEA